MNSDLMPSPESSNKSTSDETLISKEIPADVQATESQPENSPSRPSENNDTQLANRLQPIPPPSEPLQYRAIGLVRGRYLASSEQFTQGIMLTTDETPLEAVLLGRIMSLVKNHLDLEKEHLWVVYPRTRQENDKLHLQIVGVWEPENLAKNLAQEDEDLTEQEKQISNNGLSQHLTPSSEIIDGGFSVRGEVVYQSFDTGNLVIKIKQAARKPTDKAKYFKLKIKGKLDTKAVGKFWDLQVKREADDLVVGSGEAIAELPKKRRPPMRGGGGRRPPSGGSRKPFLPRKSGETPRPIKKTGDASSPTPPRPSSPLKPIPKPVKRPKPPET
ncbi:hypothetical protein [Iningainema tapete]|uniref:Uncharacterized protein n=1 Tax=Iningainema tapete BLCC-T55 TaxID=2748662 RepID=A0A8J6XH35_9CYAN|nr:hypothetical protein [Iningainema tapete]MBD2772437.1 hypothetical protein [Iningainema tapete BLCC-T55]